MSVNSVTGQDLIGLFADRAAAAPAPQSRTVQAPEAIAPKALAPGEEQVQRSAENPGAAEVASVLSTNRPRLRVDEESQQIVIQIVDKNNEVVKQIPPEDLLQLSQKFDRLQGLLFDQTT